MNFRVKMAGLVAGVLGALVVGMVSASAGEIVGNWTTQSGETAKISACGGDYCIVLTTGTYAGKTIGRLTDAGDKYEGTILDPADDKEYSGSAVVEGARMELKGCAMMVFCQTQIWVRQ